MAKTYININGDVRDADSLKLPNNRSFRAAWHFDDNIVEVDMSKAKEIKKDSIRQERRDVLEQLDAEFMQALERGDDAEKEKVAVKKQKLRDATKSSKLSRAKTPEELEALTLDDLIK